MQILLFFFFLFFWRGKETTSQTLSSVVMKTVDNPTLHKPTCGVGEGGAASTGDRVMALLATLNKATAPSSCCLGLDDPRSPISNSRPAWTDAQLQIEQPMKHPPKGFYTTKNNIRQTYGKYLIKKKHTMVFNKYFFLIICWTKMSKSQSHSSLESLFWNSHKI